MIVICPDCSTRYIVADSSIGEGRQVSCANCAHMWFQEPAGKKKAAAQTPAPVERPLAEKEEGLRQYKDDAPALDFDGDVQFDPIPESVKPIPEDTAVSVEEDGDEARESVPLNPHILGYGMAASVFVVIMAGVFLFKPQITQAWPATALLYETLGMKVHVAGEGLIFDRIHAKAQTLTNGTEVLKMSGTVINLTPDSVQVPLIVASLRSEDGNVHGSWIIEPGIDTLEGEGTFPFEVEYPLASKEITSVNVTFMTGKIKKEKEEEEQHAEAAPMEEEPPAEEHTIEPAQHH